MAKRLKPGVFIAAAALGLACAGAPWFVQRAAVHSLQALFPQSTVSISSCGYAGFTGLVLRGISIQRKPWYAVNVEQVLAEIKPADLLRGKITRCLVKGVQADITASRIPLKDLPVFVSLPQAVPAKQKRPAAAAPVVGIVQVESVRYSLRTRDMSASGSISLKADMVRRLLERIDARVDAFDGWGLTLKGVCLAAGPGLGNTLSVDKLVLRKAAFSGLQGACILADGTIEVPGFTLQAFGGSLSGTAGIQYRDAVHYYCQLKADSLSMASFVEAFELQEKFTMQGRLSGKVRVAGSIPGTPKISGGFLTQAPGGTLVIRDKPTLAAIAKTNSLPLEIAAETFKHYQYTSGAVNVAGGQSNVAVHAALDGPAGTFDYTITYTLMSEQGGKKP